MRRHEKTEEREEREENRGKRKEKRTERAEKEKRRASLAWEDAPHVVDALMIFRDGVLPQWEVRLTTQVV